MKKNILLITTLLCTLFNSFAEYELAGPRTIFELNTNKGTGKYTFFNFDSGKEVTALDSNSTAWHIGFSATTVILNGGASGPGTVTGQMLSGTSFETQTSAPTSGYVSDATIKAISGWYNYYPGAGFTGPHTIIPISDKLAAIKLSDGRYVKLEFLNYYLGAPLNVPTVGAPYTVASKYYSFRYQISASASTDWSSMETTINNLRADYSHYNFFSLATGDTISYLDSNSTKWDLAFKGTTILVNNTLSGPDLDSAKVLPIDFDELGIVELSGFAVDGSTKAIPTGSNNGWYSYSGPPSHLITPIPGRTLVVKLSNGRLAKIEIQSYYKDQNTSLSGSHYSFRYYFQPDGSTELASNAFATNIKPKTEMTLSISPNPVETGEYLHLALPANESYQFSLFNASGNLVSQGETSGSIFIPETAPGIYLLHVNHDTHSMHTKLSIH
jgi:hypothetical protein